MHPEPDSTLYYDNRLNYIYSRMHFEIQMTNPPQKSDYQVS